MIELPKIGLIGRNRRMDHEKEKIDCALSQGVGDDSRRCG
jgi:hypothetical protein